MKRSIPTGAWLAAGLVTAALVVPGVSAAAAALTQIVGTNGTTVADVSKAHQLLTAPATPASLFSLTGNISTTASTACTSLGAIPAGKAAILRDLRFTVFTGSFTDDAVNLFANSSCSGAAIGRLGLTAGNGEMTFDPGIAIPAGGSASYVVINNSGTRDGVSYAVDGYSVPSGSVPSATPAIGRRHLGLP